MKKFLFLLLALVLSVSVSCSDDKTGDTGGSMLSVTPAEIEFEAAGGSRLLDLRTDAGAWSLKRAVCEARSGVARMAQEIDGRY